MAKRDVIQKKIKAYKRGTKRRGKRYAIFSGRTTKTIAKMVEVLEHEGEDKVRLKRVAVYVGEISLSKQVVNTGSTLNKERMQTYYDRAPKDTTPKTLAEVLGLVKDPRYAHVWWETPITNKVSLFQDDNARLDLFWHGTVWFFVELDFSKKIIRRSRDYSNYKFAMSRLGNISWEMSAPLQL